MLVAFALFCGPQKKIHAVLMIEKPTLRELLKELIVRCVRSMLPPSG